MARVRVSVSVPEKVATCLRSTANASAVVAEAVSRYRVEQLEQELTAAYAADRTEAAALNDEWEATSAEVGRWWIGWHAAPSFSSTSTPPWVVRYARLGRRSLSPTMASVGTMPSFRSCPSRPCPTARCVPTRHASSRRRAASTHHPARSPTRSARSPGSGSPPGSELRRQRRWAPSILHWRSNSGCPQLTRIEASAAWQHPPCRVHDGLQVRAPREIRGERVADHGRLERTTC